jgi:CheY-like chemotaxis protein
LKKILVIENDVDTLYVLEIILKNSKFKVVKSERKVPLQEILDLKPCAIIIDYLLSDGYGDELCLEIKSNPLTKHIPVILYSAGFNIKQLAENSGADAYISKPFDVNDFLQLINQVVL